MDFTPLGRELLAELSVKTGLSRNAILGVLALQHADELVFHGPPGVVFPNKAQAVLSIRVTAPAAARLTAARRRTKRSFSDIGEALVRWFGTDTTYPAPPPQAPTRAAGRRGQP